MGLKSICEKTKRKIDAMSKKQEVIIIIAFYSVIVLLTFLIMRLFNCGYHLVDDKDFLYYNDLIKVGGKSLGEVINEVFWQDMSYRFRPIWTLVRLFTSLMFGINLLPYTIMRIIELLIGMVTLHSIARRRHNSFWASLFFVLISYVGYQSCNWWKLGTPEIRAVMVFAVGFWCLLKYLDEKKKCFAVLSILVFVNLCMSKENFILLIPFVMLYIVYYDLQENRISTSWKTVCESIKKYRVLLIFLALMFVLPIAYILTHLSTDVVSLDGSGGVSESIEINKKALQTDLKWFARFGVLFVAIMLTFWDNLKKMWKEILLTLAFVLPQIAIYFAAGITERYILPFSLGYAYFFVLVAWRKGFLKGARRVIYVVGIILLLLAHTRVALREAEYYRLRGNSTQTMLDTVVNLSKENPGIKVLSCLYPNIEGDNTIYYYERWYGLDNMYVWVYDEETVNSCELRFYNDMFATHPTEYKPTDMDVIVAYNHDDRHWCHDVEFDVSEYEKIKCGTLDIYVKPDKLEKTFSGDYNMGGLWFHL